MRTYRTWEEMYKDLYNDTTVTLDETRAKGLQLDPRFELLEEIAERMKGDINYMERRHGKDGK